MAETTYNYIVSTDFPEGIVSVGNLSEEIRSSAIVTALERIDLASGTLGIVFKDSLSAGDKTLLDGDTSGPAGGLIALHDSTPVEDPHPVSIKDVSVTTEMHPETIGYEMCDRDIKFNTCTWDEFATLTVSGADANGDVTYQHPRRSALGNSVTVEHTVGLTGAGNEDRALAVTLTGKAIKVEFGTDGSGNSITPTATQVADAVNAVSSIKVFAVATAGGDGTSTVGTTAATALSGGTSLAVEDFKIDPVTLTESEWYECTLYGIYKNDSGSMVLCNDQVDANTYGILSVYDYYAQNQTDYQLIPWDIKAGEIYVDETIPLAEKFDHRAYAIGVPEIPAASGGVVRLFDGYLGHLAGKSLVANSTTAKNLSPNLGFGELTSKVRIYIYHPAGNKREHILRLVTYRPPGTT